MNKYLLTLVAIMALTACGKREEPEPAYTAMTNDQIIFETKKCRDAGLQATGYVVSATNQSIITIQCSP